MTKEKLIEEMVYLSPLTLLVMKDEEDINIVNNYLPYSIGMEFECHKKENYNVDNFRKIPNILDVNVDNSEQRYRIPNGIKGLICLYNISEQLKINSLIDMGSSVHFHVDMTDCWKKVTDTFQKSNNTFIIDELKSWKTALNLDYATQGSWYKYNCLQTLEIRIGEPTFDYNVLIKRIIQCCNIVKRLKDELEVKYKPEFQRINGKEILEYINTYSFPSKDKLDKLNEQLKQLKSNEVSMSTDDYLQQLKLITNNRVIKINNH